jgi:hypothetical protein
MKLATRLLNFYGHIPYCWAFVNVTHFMFLGKTLGLSLNWGPFSAPVK